METEAIASALGGRKVLGRVIKKPDDLAKLVREGLPAGSVTALAAKRLHLGNNVLVKEARYSAAHADSPAERGISVDVCRIRSHGPHGAFVCPRNRNDRRPEQSH